MFTMPTNGDSRRTFRTPKAAELAEAPVFLRPFALLQGDFGLLLLLVLEIMDPLPSVEDDKVEDDRGGSFSSSESVVNCTCGTA